LHEGPYPLRRLHFPQLRSSGQHQALDPAQRDYLDRVLGVKDEQVIEVFDGRGNRALARALITTTPGSLAVDRILEAEPIPDVRLHLGQALTSPERFDRIIQQGVELGVCRIDPLVTEDSAPSVARAVPNPLQPHWQHINAITAAQCGRSHLAVISNPSPIAAWLHDCRCADLRLLLDPGGQRLDQEICKAAVTGLTRIAVLVGPEHGLSPAETARARAAGFIATSLGPRLLRVETAVLAALTLIQHILRENA